jgi:general stress protein CsbA
MKFGFAVVEKNNYYAIIFKLTLVNASFEIVATQKYQT